MMSIKPVILCGGSGTRLWPLSTPEAPKQFQTLVGNETMIQQTVRRVVSKDRDGPIFERLLVVGSGRHESLLAKQLPGADLILEPFGRNSAPAVAAACLAASENEILLIMPADHHIEKPEQFLRAVQIGQTAAEGGSIVTFGIKPTHAATGYGYIESDGDAENAAIGRVKRFVEKPPKKDAEVYLEKGNYSWNSGIFLFKVSVMLDALRNYLPDMLSKMQSMLPDNQDGRWELDPEIFRNVEDISIDYAVMERESNIMVVPVNMGWSDLGGYAALWDLLSDPSRTTVASGPVLVDDSVNVFARSDGPIVAASGLKDVSIIAKNNLIMVAPLSDPNAAKSLGKMVQSLGAAINISDESSRVVRDLLSVSFKKWVECAWDDQNGGFVECLFMNGQPDKTSDRRVRVQARQIFSFAESIRLGLIDSAKPMTLIEKGLDFLDTTCRNPEGGWHHRLSATGDAIDKTRDLYDHAFIILAGATAYAATHQERALRIAIESIDYIDANLKDRDGGGYVDSGTDQTVRRSNPHMHLLEAFLAMYQATQDKQYLDRATEIVLLFETRFFDSKSNILREYFDGNWAPADGAEGELFEPGHHYEWATLLAMYDEVAARDTRSWRTRLIRTADQYGRSSTTGFAHNSVLFDGTLLDSNCRIWHQLEMFRARLFHPDTDAPGATDRVLADLIEGYFKPAIEGTWIDEVDSEGTVLSDRVPASILYHLVTAFSPALRK